MIGSEEAMLVETSAQKSAASQIFSISTDIIANHRETSGYNIQSLSHNKLDQSHKIRL